MLKGEETPEQQDQDFQGSLVLSASSSSIKQQLHTDESTVGNLYLHSESPVGSSTPALLWHLWTSIHEHSTSAQLNLETAKTEHVGEKKIAFSISEAGCYYEEPVFLLPEHHPFKAEHPFCASVQ